MARFVVEILDLLDISVLENSYTGSGSDVYHPRIKAALLFNSYFTGRLESNEVRLKSEAYARFVQQTFRDLQKTIFDQNTFSSYLG